MDSEILQNRKRGRNPGKKIWIPVLAVLFLAAASGLGYFGFWYHAQKKLENLIASGHQYLETGDYDEARAAFQGALEIAPENGEAYLGIVEADIGKEEFEQAFSDAEEGYGLSGDEKLKEQLRLLESGEIFALRGWKMRMSSYDGEGNIVFWHQYNYDLKKRMKSVTKYNAQGEAEQTLELTYDEEGRKLVSYVHAEKSGDLYKWVYKYPDDGKNVHITRYEKLSDTVMGYRDEERDAYGKLLKITDSDPQGEVTGVGVYEYGGDKPVRYSFFDSDGRLIYEQLYEYDGDRLIRISGYGEDGLLRSYEEKDYDADGAYAGCRSYTADGVLMYEYRE